MSLSIIPTSIASLWGTTAAQPTAVQQDDFLTGIAKGTAGKVAIWFTGQTVSKLGSHYTPHVEQGLYELASKALGRDPTLSEKQIHIKATELAQATAPAVIQAAKAVTNLAAVLAIQLILSKAYSNS